MTFAPGFPENSYSTNLDRKLQRVIDMHVEPDVSLEPKPSTMTVSCTCKRVHRLYHNGNMFTYHCEETNKVYTVEKKMVSITPSNSPEHAIMPPATAYIIPARRIFAKKLTFGEN